MMDKVIPMWCFALLVDSKSYGKSILYRLKDRQKTRCPQILGGGGIKIFPKSDGSYLHNQLAVP